MKKIYLLAIGFLMTSAVSLKAQTVLLMEDFETTAFYNKLDSVNALPNNTADTMWYSWDGDGIADASGANRPEGFFAINPFSAVDHYPTIYGGTPPDSNTVIGSNSWTNLGEATDGNPGENNWLVTPNVMLGSHDTLFFKAAPRQTPRYMDGYEVLLSTTDNNDLSFADTLFRASETIVEATAGDTVYADYTFAPATGFIHGADGMFLDCACGATSHAGQLRMHTVPLDAYAGKNVFIAFHHNSHDDNLWELDDVMVRGTNDAGVHETSNDVALNVYPNPATDFTMLNMDIKTATQVVANIYDVTGKLISSTNMGTLVQGRHYQEINTSSLAKGFYTISLVTKNSVTTTKLIVE